MNTAIVHVAYVENQVAAYKTALRVTKFELMCKITTDFLICLIVSLLVLIKTRKNI